MVLAYPGQLTEKMGTADCMLYIRIVPVRSPAVMHGDPFEFREDTALLHADSPTFGADIKVGVFTVWGIDAIGISGQEDIIVKQSVM